VLPLNGAKAAAWSGGPRRRCLHLGRERELDRLVELEPTPRSMNRSECVLSERDLQRLDGSFVQLALQRLEAEAVRLGRRLGGAEERRRLLRLVGCEHYRVCLQAIDDCVRVAELLRTFEAAPEDDARFTVTTFGQQREPEIEEGRQHLLLLAERLVQSEGLLTEADGALVVSLHQGLIAHAGQREGDPPLVAELAKDRRALLVERHPSLGLALEDGRSRKPVEGPCFALAVAERAAEVEDLLREGLELRVVAEVTFEPNRAANGEPQAPRLVALVRKRLVRPDTPQIAGEEAYRFRHLLIRDAAYDALPKAVRAELHERFSGWLEERAADLVELDEILGHHLEQASRYKTELGQPDPVLAERAAARLAAAGRRALGRGDERAAVSLLERSLALTRPLRLDVHLEVDLAQARGADPRQAAAIAERAAQRAADAGDPAGELLGRVVSARYRLDFEDTVEELDALAGKAVPVLERAGDHAGLAHVWNALGEVANHRGDWDEITQNRERALEHARKAGQPMQAAGPSAAYHFVLGSEPADALLRKLEALLPTASHPGLVLNQARLLAMLDRPSEAWALALQGSERLRELTGEEGGENYLADVASLTGDEDAASCYLRVYCDRLEAQHRLNNLSTYAPLLARSLCALGRYDEAEPLAERGRALGHEEDLMTQMLWRAVQARVLARRGLHVEAGALAREAVAIVERTNGLNGQGNAWCDLAEVLAASGQGDEAAAALEQAHDRYERKRNHAMARRMRERLAELQPA
jgi:hypothetical protein